VRDLTCLITIGRVFEGVADALLKHLFPYVTVIVLGAFNRASDSDLSDVVGR